MAATDPPLMAQLARAVAVRTRWDREVDRLVVAAMAAGENQTVIATTIGRSREHLRTIKRRVDNDYR